MLASAQMSDHARAEVEMLLAEGIQPTPEEIVEINALGWAIERPEIRRHLARGVPVPVGGAWLWPLTLRAEDWMRRVGREMKPAKLDRMRHPIVSGGLGTVALAYAMAHAYVDGPQLDATGDEAREAVIAWGSRLLCGMRELEVAIDQVVEQDESPAVPRGPDGAAMSIGDFSAHLAVTCGGDPEFWERRCSVGYARAVSITVAMQNAADGKPITEDPTMQAERAMGMKLEAIRQRAAGHGE